MEDEETSGGEARRNGRQRTRANLILTDGRELSMRPGALIGLASAQHSRNRSQSSFEIEKSG